MNARTFERLQELFHQACDLSPSEQKGFLDRLQGEDESLKATLIRMLGAESNTYDPLSDLQVELGQLTSEAMAKVDSPPEQIADFKILDTIGSGGMGTVFRAEQKSPKRVVALKVIRADSSTEASRRRFALESEVLGRLHHPHIAQIFEAGIAAIEGPNGVHEQPYFAMEFVDGGDFLQYANSQTRIEQIQLVIRLLDAVHHAHQRGVIHRDLKPANILVPENGHLKVLDFGIARLLDESPEDDFLTKAGQFVGTIPYVSPEQVSGASIDVDIRSDVYSIGVILYEILGGRRPWKTEGKTLLEALRIVSEEDAPQLGAVSKDLRGDLEVICHRALEKDPARRYASAHEFAADLRRFLRHEPIEARPPSAFYHFAKFTRRHRGLVAGMGLAAIIGVVAILFLTQFARQETEAKKEAQRARDMALENLRVADSVNRFLDEILSASNPQDEQGAGMTGITLLDALKYAEQGFDDLVDEPPLVEGSIRSSIGGAFTVLGEYDDARRHLEKAISLFDQHAEPFDSRRLFCLYNMAELELGCGFPDRAEPYAIECWKGYRERYGKGSSLALKGSVVYLKVLNDRGLFQQSYDLAKQTYEETLETYGGEHRLTLLTRHNFSALLYDLGRFDEAESHLVEVIEREKKIRGEKHSRTYNSISLLSNVYWRQGRFDEAEELCRAVIEHREAHWGKDHQRTLGVMNNLAILLGEKQQWRDAETVRRDQRRRCQGALGDQHPLTRNATFSLAILLRNTGRFEESESLLRPLVELERQLEASSLPDTLNALGIVLGDLKQTDDALEVYEELMGWVEETELGTHWRSIIFRANFGNSLRDSGLIEDAEIELLDAYAEIRKILGDSHYQTGYVASLLVRLYVDQEDQESADRMRARHGLKD